MEFLIGIRHIYQLRRYSSVVSLRCTIVPEHGAVVSRFLSDPELMVTAGVSPSLACSESTAVCLESSIKKLLENWRDGLKSLQQNIVNEVGSAVCEWKASNAGTPTDGKIAEQSQW